MSAVTDELEELEQMAKIAGIYGHEPGSRWWKERAKLISDKYKKRAREEAGLDDDERPGGRSRMAIQWGSDTHYGVEIKKTAWADAIAEAKAEHEDATDWEQDAPRAGKCKMDGELKDFKRFKASWPGGGVLRIRVVSMRPGLYLAQVCLVGRVDRYALVH